MTYNVENQGTVASDAFYVDLYLSTNKTISPAAERLLKNVSFSTGLAPGQSVQTTTKVLVPINGLSGKYYYGAMVGSSKMASSKQVSLVRYSLSGGGDTVTDHKTGLIWQRGDDGQYRNWDAAGQYCADLSLGGKRDWRLPSMDELLTIVDYSRFLPAINPVFDCNDDYYWSSTLSAEYPQEGRWPVRFTDGYAQVASMAITAYVRCVRGGP